MPRPGPDHPLTARWRYGAIRTLLVSYGVAAFTYILAYTTPQGSLPDYASSYTAPLLLLSGLALQILLIILRIVIRRHLASPELAAQTLLVLELVSDGVTVLLFALGTFGALMQSYAIQA